LKRGGRGQDELDCLKQQDAEVFLVHVIPKAEIPEDLRRLMDTEYADAAAEVV
jgi:hypothetical protein